MFRVFSRTQPLSVRVEFNFFKTLPTLFHQPCRNSGSKCSTELSEPLYPKKKSKKNAPKGKRLLQKWTDEDRETLTNAVKRWGNHWSHISKLYFPDRSPNSCYQMYLNMNSTFKKGPWTAEEDESLKALSAMKEYAGQWKMISETINRSSASCYYRWHSRFRPDIKTGRWTEEEDRILLEGVDKYGRDWEKIVQDIPGRSGRHALLRYDKFLCPNTNRGKWSAEEDELLLREFQKHGRSWTKIAESIPHRTPFQVQARYDTHVNPNITRGRWTPEESKLLLELVDKYGHDWTRVSQELATKSNMQAVLRYSYLRGKQKKTKESEPKE